MGFCHLDGPALWRQGLPGALPTAVGAIDDRCGRWCSPCMLRARGLSCAAEPLLRLLNTPQDVLPGALLYLRIMSTGASRAVMAYNFLSGHFAGPGGQPKRPLYAIAGGGPDERGSGSCSLWWASTGALPGRPFATVVSQVASAVYCFFNVRKITILQVLPGDLKPWPGFDPHFAEAGLPHGLAERHHRHGQHGGAVCHQRLRHAVPGGLYRHQQALRPAGDWPPPPTASR